MKRFLAAPIAAIALLTVAVPAGAQALDARAELLQLRQEQRAYNPSLRAFLRQIGKCETPDPAAVEQLLAQTNALSRHAAGVAWQLGGRDHASAMEIHRTAEWNFWQVIAPTIPDKCYQPPM